MSPISSLNPYSTGNWTIKARVSNKSQVRTYQGKGNQPGKLFSVELVDQDIDLGHFKARIGNLEPQIEIEQLLQLHRHNLAIKLTLVAELVVCNDIGPAFGCGHMIKPDGWDAGQAKPLRRLRTTMAAENLALSVDQHRAVKAKALDRLGDLAHLCIGMLARVFGVGL